MNLRAMVRLAPALAGMVLLAGCPVVPHNVVVNDTGAEIRVQNPDKSIFAALSREITLKPGARWDMWAYTENAEVRAGNCTYTWPDLASDDAWQALRGSWATPEQRLAAGWNSACSLIFRSGYSRSMMMERCWRN